MKRNSKTFEVLAVCLPDFMELQMFPFLTLFSFQYRFGIISSDHFIALICVRLNPNG